MRLEHDSFTGHPLRTTPASPDPSRYRKGLWQAQKPYSAACYRDWQHARARPAFTPCLSPHNQHQNTPQRSRILPFAALIPFRLNSRTQYELPLPQYQVPIVLKSFSFILTPKSSPSPFQRFRQDPVRVQARHRQRQGLCHGRRQQSAP